MVGKVRQMLKAGSDSHSIIAYLANQHLSSDEITYVIEKTVNNPERTTSKGGGPNILIILLGIVLIVGGIVLSVSTESFFMGLF